MSEGRGTPLLLLSSTGDAAIAEEGACPKSHTLVAVSARLLAQLFGGRGKGASPAAARRSLTAAPRQNQPPSPTTAAFRKTTMPRERLLFPASPGATGPGFSRAASFPEHTPARRARQHLK